MLDKFYTLNVIQGNDLSYGRCKKVQERPYSAFPAKGRKHNYNSIIGTTIYLVPRTIRN